MDEPLQPSRKPLGFWKTVLATFVGGLTASIVFSVLAFFFLVSLLIGSLLSQSAPKTIEENSVLKTLGRPSSPVLARESSPSP